MNPPSNWECDDFYGGGLLRLPLSHRNCKARRFEPMVCARGKEKIHQKCDEDGVTELITNMRGAISVSGWTRLSPRIH